MNLNHYIQEKHWLGDRVSKSVENWASINASIQKARDQYDQRVLHLESLSTAYSVDDIIKEEEVDESTINSTSFYSYADQFAERYKRQQKYNSIKRHKTVIKKFQSFTGPDLLFEDISQKLLEQYQDHLSSNANKTNTVSKYMAILKSIYNSAIDDGIAPQGFSPFYKLRLKTEKVTKDKLTRTELDRLANLELSKGSWLFDTRNYFMASFYL